MCQCPQVFEKTVEMVKSVSHERLQRRTVEQSVDAPQGPETVEVVTLVPRERVQQRTVELSVTNY